MKSWQSRLSGVLLLAAVGWLVPPAHGLEGVLRWNSGDTLGGALAGADATNLTWRCPRFPAALQLDPRYLFSIEFDSSDPSPTSAVAPPFRVTTSAGDILFGRLTGMDADVVRLAGERFGEVVLNRAAVRELRHLQYTQVVYDGPRGLDGWDVLKAGRRVSEWTATDSGYLRTETYGAEIFHALPSGPENKEIQLSLRWTGKPGFQLGFSSAAELASSRAKLSIKTWSDDVVAQTSLNASDFSHLVKLDAGRTELRLRIDWNERTGEIGVFDQSGQRLAELLTEPQNGTAEFGVLIKNRGQDLTVEHLRITRWNGSVPSLDRGGGAEFLRLADGAVVTGRIIDYQPQSNEFTVAAPDGPRPIPAEQFALAEFVPTAFGPTDGLRVRFDDGNELVGELRGIDEQRMTLHTEIARRPLDLRLQGVREMRFLDGLRPAPEESRFRLRFADGRELRGLLAAADVEGTPGWRAAGSFNAVPLPQAGVTIQREPLTDSLRAERARESKAQSPPGAGVADNAPTTRSTDASDASSSVDATAAAIQASSKPLGGATEMIFFQDGSSVAGRVRAIDADYLQLETAYAEPARVALRHVKAVEMFTAAGRVSFASDDWDFLRDGGPVQRSFQSLEVTEPVSFRDLDLEHGGRVTLSCAWDEDFVGLLTVHLGTSHQPRTSIARFTFKQDRVTARCLQQPVSYRELPPIPSRRATISLQAQDETLSVWVNGVLAFDARLKSAVATRGLWIQCGSARGRFAASAGEAVYEPRLVLDELRVGRNAGVENLGFVDQDQRRVLLQVPRVLRDNTPRHVLCATNGDVLRGELLGLDEVHVRFRSRLADLVLPRAQLAALIWLSNEGEHLGGDAASLDDGALPDADTGNADVAVLPTAGGGLRLVLSDGSSFTIQRPRIAGNGLRGDQPLLGDCQVELSELVKLQVVGSGGSADVAGPFADWTLFSSPEPRFGDGTGASAAEQGVDSPLLSQRAPDLTLTLLGGGEFRLREHEDQVVVLDFWTTWCAPCTRTLPELQQTAGAFPADQVSYIAVNQQETEDAVRDFLLARNLDMAVALDGGGAAGRQFQVEAIPQTVVIAPGGRIDRVFVGAPAGLRAGVEQAIRRLLDEVP